MLCHRRRTRRRTRGRPPLRRLRRLPAPAGSLRGGSSPPAASGTASSWASASDHVAETTAPNRSIRLCRAARNCCRCADSGVCSVALRSAAAQAWARSGWSLRPAWAARQRVGAGRGVGEDSRRARSRSGTAPARGPQPRSIAARPASVWSIRGTARVLPGRRCPAASRPGAGCGGPIIAPAGGFGNGSRARRRRADRFRRSGRRVAGRRPDRRCGAGLV